MKLYGILCLCLGLFAIMFILLQGSGRVVGVVARNELGK